MARLTPPEVTELVEALKKHYRTDVLFGQGGFFLKGIGHIPLSRARKVTGIKGKLRTPRMVTGGYGDYATLRKIVGRI